MILGLSKSLTSLLNDYNIIAKNKKISNRAKCIFLRVMFEHYCYQLLIIFNLLETNKAGTHSKYKEYKECNKKEWHPRLFTIWVEKQINEKFKFLWGNKSVVKAICNNISNDKNKIKEAFYDFKTKYYDKFLIPSHHHKKLEVTDEELKDIMNNINILFSEKLSRIWLESEVELIKTKSYYNVIHIKQNSNYMCAAKISNQIYRKEIGKILKNVRYLIINISKQDAKTGSFVINYYENNYNKSYKICNFCIKRILGIIDYSNRFIAFDQIKNIIKQNLHIIEKL